MGAMPFRVAALWAAVPLSVLSGLVALGDLGWRPGMGAAAWRSFGRATSAT